MIQSLLWQCPFESGFLEGELTLPADPLALILIPHPLYFRTDVSLQHRLSALHRLGFASLCCNLHNLEDLHRPKLLSDINRTTERLLAILQQLQSSTRKPMYPRFLYAHHALCPAAVRAVATRDLAVDRLICAGGKIGDAGKQYLAHLVTPTLFQHDHGLPTPSHPFITSQENTLQNHAWFNDNCISWMAQEVLKIKNITTKSPN